MRLLVIALAALLLLPIGASDAIRTQTEKYRADNVPQSPADPRDSVPCVAADLLTAVARRCHFEPDPRSTMSCDHKALLSRDTTATACFDIHPGETRAAVTVRSDIWGPVYDAAGDTTHGTFVFAFQFTEGGNNIAGSYQEFCGGVTAKTITFLPDAAFFTLAVGAIAGRSIECQTVTDDTGEFTVAFFE